MCMNNSRICRSLHQSLEGDKSGYRTTVKIVSVIQEEEYGK